MEFKVVGANTVDGRCCLWHFPTRELAEHFAKQTCRDTGNDYYVLQLLGTWQRAIEFVEATGD